MNDQDSQRRVVIIGGGFAGLFAARVLRRAPVRVTLIDRRPHHLFQPLLYQCSTGILSEGKIAVPLRDLLRKHKNADFVLAEVTTKTLRAEYRHIKPEDARVLLFDGGDAPLAPFGPELSAKAARTLSKLGVEQHMHSIVTGIDATGLSVRAQDGTVTRHEAGTVLWTAGVAAPPVAAAIAAATGAKQ